MSLLGLLAETPTIQRKAIQNYFETLISEKDTISVSDLISFVLLESLFPRPSV